MAINVGETTVGYSAAQMIVTIPATLKQNDLESDSSLDNYIILLTQHLTAIVSFLPIGGMRNLDFQEMLTVGNPRQRDDFTVGKYAISLMLALTKYQQQSKHACEMLVFFEGSLDMHWQSNACRILYPGYKHALTQGHHPANSDSALLM